MKYKIYQKLGVFTGLILSLGAIHSQAQQTFINNQAANGVIGQVNFTNQESPVSQVLMNQTACTAISSKGAFAVADYAARRVLLWKQIPLNNGTPADVVVGQPDFTSIFGDHTQSRMHGCYGVTFTPDGNKLIVCDSFNNRVLIWNTIPTTNGTPASVVVGQPDFVTDTPGTLDNKLRNPTHALVTANGQLLIADKDNNRVLIFNTVPTANNASADRVIGQMTMNTMAGGAGTNEFTSPASLAFSGNKLLVADYGNFRVMIFNGIPTTNGAIAINVIGQTNWGASTSSGTSATKFGNVWGVAASPAGQVAIADYNHHRVLIYNSVPTVNGAAANVVLGQDNFTSANQFNGGVSAKSMSLPFTPCFDSNGRLFVGGLMKRVLMFGQPALLPALSGFNGDLSGNGSVDVVAQKKEIVTLLQMSTDGASIEDSTKTLDLSKKTKVVGVNLIDGVNSLIVQNKKDITAKQVGTTFSGVGEKSLGTLTKKSGKAMASGDVNGDGLADVITQKGKILGGLMSPNYEYSELGKLKKGGFKIIGAIPRVGTTSNAATSVLFKKGKGVFYYDIPLGGSVSTNVSTNSTSEASGIEPGAGPVFDKSYLIAGVAPRASATTSKLILVKKKQISLVNYGDTTFGQGVDFDKKKFGKVVGPK